MLKTWYDQLFYRNKIDIIKLVGKEVGYKVVEHDWNPDIKFGSTSLKSRLALKKEEIIELGKKIYLGEQKDPKYKYYIENISEQIAMREKFLKGIQDTQLYMELACDQEKFTNSHLIKVILPHLIYHHQIIDLVIIIFRIHL